MDYKIKAMAAMAEILKAYSSDAEGVWMIGYSGGKDSSVTAALVFKALLLLKPEQRTRKIYITSAQTRLDLTTDPTKQNEVKRMHYVIDQHNLPIKIVEVEADKTNSFVYKVLGMGYPLPKSRMNRWCSDALKIVPQQKFAKELNPALTLLGVRSSESVARSQNIEGYRTSQYYGDDGKFMPIIDFTLDDVWMYLAKEKLPWGDAEEISQLYKDATGECGLSKRKAGKGEKIDDPCGARFGCVICPVVTIDKSTQEMAKIKPWFQPYVELRNEMIEMYKDPRNKAGRMRNGTPLEYGQGTFTVKARMRLFEMFEEAEEANKFLAEMHEVEPQPIFFDDIRELIVEQWQADLREKPYLEDAEELGRYFTFKNQITWNHYYDVLVGSE